MKIRPLWTLISFLSLGAVLSLSVNSLRAEPKQEAVTALEQAVHANPNNAELWMHLGFAYRKVDQIDQAQGAFEKAASLDPNNHDALFMLGLIYEKKNMKQDAERVWKQYLSTEKDPLKRSDAEKHLHQVGQ